MVKRSLTAVVISQNIEVKIKIESVLNHFLINCFFLDDSQKNLEISSSIGGSIDFIFLDYGEQKISSQQENIKKIKILLNSDVKIFYVIYNDHQIDLDNLKLSGIDDIVFFPVDIDILKFKLSKYASNYNVIKLNQNTIYPSNDSISNKIVLSCELLEISDEGVVFLSDAFIAAGENVEISCEILIKVIFKSTINVTVRSVVFSEEYKKYNISSIFNDLTIENRLDIKKWIDIQNLNNQ